MEILFEQKLEINNLLTFRGTVKNSEINDIVRDMDMYIKKNENKRTGFPITVTYKMDTEKADVEILIPIEKEIKSSTKYVFKPKLKITNAIVGRHHGNPNMLQETCNEIAKIIEEKKLVQITPGYSVTKQVDELGNADIEVWVGISPNIL